MSLTLEQRRALKRALINAGVKIPGGISNQDLQSLADRHQAAPAPAVEETPNDKPLVDNIDKTLVDNIDKPLVDPITDEINRIQSLPLAGILQSIDELVRDKHARQTPEPHGTSGTKQSIRDLFNVDVDGHATQWADPSAPAIDPGYVYDPQTLKIV